MVVSLHVTKIFAYVTFVFVIIIYMKYLQVQNIANNFAYIKTNLSRLQQNKLRLKSIIKIATSSSITIINMPL